MQLDPFSKLQLYPWCSIFGSKSDILNGMQLVELRDPARTGACPVWGSGGLSTPLPPQLPSTLEA